MKNFARVTKLSNIGGRADYISNPNKQEKIVAKSESVDWIPYQEFERNNQRSSTRNNEGREVIVMFPNEWAILPPEQLYARAQSVAETVVGKTTDMQWAVHWNKTYTNLHLHVIFSERQKEKNPGRWDRDVYLTDEGKVARRKSERAKNPDGSIKPPVHRKGEEKAGFTAKDSRYAKRSWVLEVKARIKEFFAEYGITIEKDGFLHQYHEGKGSDAPVIRMKNDVIKAVNRRLEDLVSFNDIGRVERSVLKPIKANMKNHKLVVPHFKDGRVQLTGFTTPEKALDFIIQTETEWRQEMSRHRQPERTPEPQKAPEPMERSNRSFTPVPEIPKRNMSSPEIPPAEKPADGPVEKAAERTAEKPAVSHPVVMEQTPSEIRIAQIHDSLQKYYEKHDPLSVLQENLQKQRQELGFMKFREKKSLDSQIADCSIRMRELENDFKEREGFYPADAEKHIQSLSAQIAQERAEMAHEAKASDWRTVNAQIRQERENEPIRASERDRQGKVKGHTEKER